jgi:hypothetical protein
MELTNHFRKSYCKSNQAIIVCSLIDAFSTFLLQKQDEKDDRGRWWIGYLVTVRITLLNGSSHEDCGSGEGINPSKIQAHDKALKSAVTDAMKRAARHFGERLGNALYVKGNGIRTAPRTNREALEVLERSDCLNLFGDQVALRDRCKMEEDVVSKQMVNQPPTPVVSTAIARQGTTHNPVAATPSNHPVMSMSTTVPRQQTAFNSGTSLSTNQKGVACVLAPAASIQQNQNAKHGSVALPAALQTTHNTASSKQPSQHFPNGSAPAAVPQNNAQGPHLTNTANQNIIANAGWDNIARSNSTNMPPPQPAARGISPETTAGSVDATKQSLTSVALGNSAGNNPVTAEDANKRQKRNPYTNNRLSC